MIDAEGLFNDILARAIVGKRAEVGERGGGGGEGGEGGGGGAGGKSKIHYNEQCICKTFFSFFSFEFSFLYFIL